MHRRIIADYDNSIRYTDGVVGDIVETVRKILPNSFVIYVSDHGETPETISRDISRPGVWEVPMIVWLSPGFRNRSERVRALDSLKDRPIKNDVLFDLVLELAGVRKVDAEE